METHSSTPFTHIASVTSHFVLAFMAAEGTAVHLINGSLRFDQAFLQAILIALGAIPGTQLGARLSHRLHGRVIIRPLLAHRYSSACASA